MSSTNDNVEEEYFDEMTDDVGVNNRTEFSCDLHKVYVNSGNQKKVLSSYVLDCVCLRLMTHPCSRLKANHGLVCRRRKCAL